MENENINLGKFLGYEMILENVPKERAEHVRKAALYHFKKMQEAYTESIFGGVKSDLEIAKKL